MEKTQITVSESTFINTNDQQPDNSIPSQKIKERPLWKGEFNVWWLFATLILILFVFYRGFPYLVDQWIKNNLGPAFATHIFTMWVLVFGCAWNLFHPPSHGKNYRSAHIIIGRIAYIFGLVSVISGFYTVWVERFNPKMTAFRIGISIGGGLQTLSQAIGFYAIRKLPKNVRLHMNVMHGLFFGGCLIPAIFRLPGILGFHETPILWNFMGPAIAFGMMWLSFRAYLRAEGSTSWI